VCRTQFCERWQHEGPYYLFKERAKLIESVGNIIEKLLSKLDESFLDEVKNATSKPVRPSAALSKEGTEVLDLVTKSPVSTDKVLA